MSDLIHREVELPCDAAEAWELLLDPTWLGGEGDLPRRAGDEGWVREGEDTRYLVVEVAEPGERYVYRWASFTDAPSRVEIDLTPIDAGTRISISESPIGLRAQASLVLR